MADNPEKEIEGAADKAGNLIQISKDLNIPKESVKTQQVYLKT